MTVAVVFTDIVDSTKLCNDLGDAVWDGIRQQHFAQAVRLVHQKQGILIKNTGDGILALFHDATKAVGFALALHHDTGHAVIRIRAGVHVGQVNIDDGDAFGRHMNLTARVMNYAKASGDRAERFPTPEPLWAVEGWTSLPPVRASLR
jgi:class 3 adenylate cyclase